MRTRGAVAWPARRKTMPVDAASPRDAGRDLRAEAWPVGADAVGEAASAGYRVVDLAR